MSGTTRASSEPGGRGGAAPFSSGRFKGGGLGLGGNPSAVCKALKLCFCLAAEGLCPSLPSLLDRRRRAFSCLAAPSDWLCWSPAGSRRDFAEVHHPFAEWVGSEVHYPFAPVLVGLRRSCRALLGDSGKEIPDVLARSRCIQDARGFWMHAGCLWLQLWRAVPFSMRRTTVSSVHRRRGSPSIEVW